MLDTLHCEDYAPHVNTPFTAQFEDGSTMELKLTEAREVSSSPRQERFVLTFLAPDHAPADQQIFNLRHEQLGDGVMFLVPVAREAEGLIYEAVFNRPKSE